MFTFDVHNYASIQCTCKYISIELEIVLCPHFINVYTFSLGRILILGILLFSSVVNKNRIFLSFVTPHESHALSLHASGLHWKAKKCSKKSLLFSTLEIYPVKFVLAQLQSLHIVRLILGVSPAVTFHCTSPVSQVKWKTIKAKLQMTVP